MRPQTLIPRISFVNGDSPWGNRFSVKLNKAAFRVSEFRNLLKTMDGMSGMEEKRRYKRFEKRLNVVWKDREFSAEGITHDISVGGVFIITQHVFPLRSRVTLKFHLKCETQSVCCEARVAWINRGQMETFPPGFGVEFLDMNKYSLELLLACEEDEET